eukprot:7441237-Pyramimonas_sp.AAC.1
MALTHAYTSLRYMARSWSAVDIAAPRNMSMTVLQYVNMLTFCGSSDAIIHMSVCITAIISPVVL